MKKLLLISTGGTISQEKNAGSTVPVGESTSVDALIAKVSEIAHDLKIELDHRSIFDKDSSNIIPDDWLTMIKVIVEEYEKYDSFLITHGTNTLGYTCAALSFALGRLGKPVILTGSQVPYGASGSDAVMNLENAFRVAVNEEEHLFGVIAVFGSQIITGARVKKTTEFEYDAFRTFSSKNSLGRIGRTLNWDKPALDLHKTFWQPIARGKTGLDVKDTFDMNIVSLTEFPGLKWQVFKSLVEGGAKGIIYRASGAGDPNVAPTDANFVNLREGFEYLREKNVPIIVTTQASEGVASMDVNAPGRLACELGAIPAWDMSMEAMTVKLAWLLGRGLSYGEIKTHMADSCRGEINAIGS